MKLFDTLTRSTQTLEPIDPKTVTVYTCGPTVYDYPHIGNWFTFVRYDTLVRTLKASDYDVTWVMNITDVGHLTSDADEGEDKLEKGAKREGKTAWDVAKFYTDNFVLGLKRLNISQPSQLPKATDHITEQIDLVKKLEDKGYTYIIDDGVYYDTSKFKQYGDFAQLDLDEQQPGARVTHNEQKRNTSDFALWKFSPKDQQRDMEWDSPWGKGFPGWHLECSAMGMKYLGETIDIHSGGIEHIPVHHTNEIAQSQAVTGKPLANLWMHTNHVTVEGTKISKSLGNGITLEDIEERGFSFEVVRLHILESHYRSQSRFSWKSLEAAHNRLQGYRALAALQHQTLSHDGEDRPLQVSDMQLSAAHILEHMQNDLNTPQALAEFSKFTELAQHRGIDTQAAESFKKYLVFVDNLFGLHLADEASITDGQNELLIKRQQARDQQDWAAADTFRDLLLEEGITVRDTPHGQVWARV